jgi:hypothetical protein
MSCLLLPLLLVCTLLRRFFCFPSQAGGARGEKEATTAVRLLPDRRELVIVWKDFALQCKDDFPRMAESVKSRFPFQDPPYIGICRSVSANLWLIIFVRRWKHTLRPRTALLAPGFDSQRDLRLVWKRWLFCETLHLDSGHTRISGPRKSSDQTPRRGYSAILLCEILQSTSWKTIMHLKPRRRCLCAHTVVLFSRNPMEYHSICRRPFGTTPDCDCNNDMLRPWRFRLMFH